MRGQYFASYLTQLRTIIICPACIETENGWCSMFNRRVLFVATVYAHLASFHIPFMRLLQEKGYEVHAAASSADGRKSDVEAAGVVCWEVPFARSPYDPSNIKAVQSLKALFDEYRFDLIHVHTPTAAFLGRYLAKKTGQGPVLYTAHGFHFYKGAPFLYWLLYYNAERLARRWTDGLMVMNGEDYENACRMGFIPDKDLFYVHGVGVDLAAYAQARFSEWYVRAELGIPAEDVVVVCVGELNSNKNQSFLLQAWNELSSKINYCHLLLVGRGEMMVRLKSMVQKKNIPRVHFLGYRADVPSILFESDIAVLTSKREGLPRCVMEAMAAGKPVVATNVRGSRDLVEHGRTGFLVEPGDVKGLAAALEKLVRNQALREKMGAAAREKVRDYSLEKVLLEMSGIYDRFLGRVLL